MNQSIIVGSNNELMHFYYHFIYFNLILILVNPDVLHFNTICLFHIFDFFQYKMIMIELSSNNSIKVYDLNTIR